jgi:hypothetical protein
MTSLPSDLNAAIAQAQAATQAALADGLLRLQIDFAFPELKIQPVAEQFIQPFTDLGDRFRIYFPDAGAAALARRDWGETPYTVRGMSDLRAEVQDSEELFLFIEPSSVEVQTLEQYCNAIGDRPTLLLNPRLEDVATIGIGYAGRQLRERFLNQWQTAYCVQPLEGAAILRTYPGPWQVWLEQEEDYTLVHETPQRPSGEELQQILLQAVGASANPTPIPQAGLLSGLQRFLRALSQ